MGINIDENNQSEILIFVIKGNLLCSIVITSNQRFTCTVDEQIISDNKKSDFSREVINKFFVRKTAQGIVITLGIIGYSSGSNLSQEYR